MSNIDVKYHLKKEFLSDDVNEGEIEKIEIIVKGVVSGVDVSNNITENIVINKNDNDNGIVIITWNNPFGGNILKLPENNENEDVKKINEFLKKITTSTKGGKTNKKRQNKKNKTFSNHKSWIVI